MTGKNIGNLLNARNVTLGLVPGRVRADRHQHAPATRSAAPSTRTSAATRSQDYVPHHDPFQYYESTANPKHLPPSSEAAIGHTDQANHQYDLSDFYKTLKDGNMPAVSFLKPPAYQDAHPGYSDPLDEQNFLVNTINQIEESKYWASTAIVITYDDSDGWYDHQAVADRERLEHARRTRRSATRPPTTLGSYQYRCGYGPRLPLLVISPWTRQNYVSSNLTDTASIIKFIEDNWLGGQRIGNGSFDAIAGSLDAPGGVLNFRTRPHFRPSSSTRPRARW